MSAAEMKESRFKSTTATATLPLDTLTTTTPTPEDTSLHPKGNVLHSLRCQVRKLFVEGERWGYKKFLIKIILAYPTM